MTQQLYSSNSSAFKPFVPIQTATNLERQLYEKSLLTLLSQYPFIDYHQKQPIQSEIQQASLFAREDEKDESSTDSFENIILNDHTSISHTSIAQKLELPKKRKNKEETKHDIQENHKDEGRGGNCIASNITKTLIRVAENRLETTLSLKFKALIEKYKIKSQKENTIIILLILYDLVKTNQLSLAMFENIFSFFMKSLAESKQNCEKKIADEPERKGFHLKNRKMYVNFININREIYSKLIEALKENGTVQMDLKTISDIISDTYDRKQRQIQKALSKLRSIILNHASLKALFGHEQNDIESTFFEAIDYAYRRNLEKRCNQTKKRVSKFINEVKKNQLKIASEEETFFTCYAAIKLVGEKEDEIWEEFAKSTNLEREFNQTKQEGEKLVNFLTKEIPLKFSRFDSSESSYKMDEESRFMDIFRTYIGSKNDMEF